MSGKGECSAWGGKTAWGRREEDCEPIVSFVEIMSEELADSLNEEERRKEQDYLNTVALSESAPVYSNDEEMAKALQREFDREYDLSVRLNQEKQKGKSTATITVTPDRYCPKTTQDSDQSSDDEDVRQFATDLLYAKLSDDVPAHSGSVYRNAGGELVTKHDANVSARRNADKTMNDQVNLAFGDMRKEQINSRVYNSLRSFSKTEAKRHHKLKDKEEKATIETSMDAVTRLHLFKWINQGVFDRVEGIIATGKESAVLNAASDETGERFAVKVYKTSLTEFKNRMAKVGLPCPVPVKLKRHLLVMSFIGEQGEAAPRLKNIDWDFFTTEERKNIFLQVQDIMCRMYKECKLVHGDLSEFNLLLAAGKISFNSRVIFYFDFSRDIENVLAFFQKLDIVDLPTPVALFNMITDLNMGEEGSLLVQVEQFSEDNRANHINKSKPADFEWAAYNKERKELRGESPARDYN
ncbi:RIO1 family protein [Necator americanus]|uniref:Serine/threonine-protein kinase RIO3 n=1 Tax=Necator americanus TaxID=51031 RepID=W2SJR3_NECAM|nr:RIO1 family protein [Necator americanus]ETN69778.1 RIO1 family protein [Necator americanus]